MRVGAVFLSSVPIVSCTLIFGWVKGAESGSGADGYSELPGESFQSAGFKSEK